jgi:hypothetical protein
MERDSGTPGGRKLVDLAARFNLSSRWFAFALVLSVLVTARQLAGIGDASGPQLILRAIWLFHALLLATISVVVIVVRYWHPARRPRSRL